MALTFGWLGQSLLVRFTFVEEKLGLIRGPEKHIVLLKGVSPILIPGMGAGRGRQLPKAERYPFILLIKLETSPRKLRYPGQEYTLSLRISAKFLRWR